MFPRIGIVGGPGGRKDSRLPHRSNLKITQMTTPTRRAESIAGDTSTACVLGALNIVTECPLCRTSGLPASHKSAFGSHRVWLDKRRLCPPFTTAGKNRNHKREDENNKTVDRPEVLKLRALGDQRPDLGCATTKANRLEALPCKSSRTYIPPAVDPVSFDTPSLILPLHGIASWAWSRRRSLTSRTSACPPVTWRAPHGFVRDSGPVATVDFHLRCRVARANQLARWI